ncbi:hypothetical protein LXL04_017578 [Taraxacum kok-saghyz]
MLFRRTSYTQEAIVHTRTDRDSAASRIQPSHSSRIFPSPLETASLARLARREFSHLLGSTPSTLISLGSKHSFCLEGILIGQSHVSSLYYDRQEYLFMTAESCMNWGDHDVEISDGCGVIDRHTLLFLRHHHRSTTAPVRCNQRTKEI